MENIDQLELGTETSTQINNNTNTTIINNHSHRNSKNINRYNNSNNDILKPEIHDSTSRLIIIHDDSLSSLDHNKSDGDSSDCMIEFTNNLFR